MKYVQTEAKISRMKEDIFFPFSKKKKGKQVHQIVILITNGETKSNFRAQRFEEQEEKARNSMDRFEFPFPVWSIEISR